MKYLSFINLTAFHFRIEGKGGMYPTTHAEGTFPAGAIFVSFDPETNTVHYKLPNGVDEDGNELFTEHERSFTEAEIEAAKTPPAPPAEVPESLSRRAFMMSALVNLSITKDMMQTAINSITDDTQRNLAQIDFDESLRFTRTWQPLESLAASLGLTAEDLDNAFIAGKDFE